MSKEKRAAKKAAKAEKKANRVSNPELTKAIISAVTAVICVIAVVITSVSITGSVLETKVEIAEKYATSNGASVDASAVDGDAYVDNSYVDDGVSVDDTVVSDDTVADAPVADDGASVDTPVADASANKADSATSSAPVGNDIAKIVAFYNTAANNTKAYKGKMSLEIEQGSSSKITETSFPQAAVSIAEGLLPNDYPTKKTYTVTNGQGDGYNYRKEEAEKKSLNDILPIDGNAKMSTLAAAGVQSATCTKDGNNYKVVIKLKPETVNSFDEKPKYHSSCMDVLDISNDDIKPFEARSMNIKYTGATLTAVINSSNMLVSYQCNEPMTINGTLGWTFIEGTATIAASWQQTVKFKY